MWNDKIEEKKKILNRYLHMILMNNIKVKRKWDIIIIACKIKIKNDKINKIWNHIIRITHVTLLDWWSFLYLWAMEWEVGTKVDESEVVNSRGQHLVKVVYNWRRGCAYLNRGDRWLVASWGGRLWTLHYLLH